MNMLDQIVPEAGAFYVMDRGYIDFERLFVLTLSAAFFVVPTKSNVLLQRRYSHPVDKSTGVRSDQTVILSSFESASVYPDPLRKVSYYDAETGKRLKCLTNSFALPALTIAQIYKQRWQVELFLKWIKQHLRIKAFYGTDLDRSVGVRAGGDCAQTARAGGHSVADQPHPFRENAHSMRPSDRRSGRQFCRKPQPTDSVRVLTGQQCSHQCVRFCSLAELVSDESIAWPGQGHCDFGPESHTNGLHLFQQRTDRQGLGHLLITQMVVTMKSACPNWLISSRKVEFHYPYI